MNNLNSVCELNIEEIRCVGGGLSGCGCLRFVGIRNTIIMGASFATYFSITLALPFLPFANIVGISSAIIVSTVLHRTIHRNITEIKELLQGTKGVFSPLVKTITDAWNAGQQPANQ